MQLITAIVPAWNRATKIRAAIESILSQTLPQGWNLEVIVVDDGSTDDTRTVLEPFGAKVTVHRHATNKGAAAARNTGIAVASGHYVAFLDSDDVWLPGKLVAQIGAMEAHGWQASCTAYRLSRFGREIVSPRWPTGTLEFDDLAWGCYVSPGSTLIARRSVFAEVGPIDTTLRRLEDWDWLLRYSEKYALGFLAEPLARIEPSGPPNFLAARAAIEAIHKKYRGRMHAGARRNFLAGLDIERAALHYRYGERAAAIFAIIKSLVRVPLNNRAVAAILHNRSLRGARE